MHALLILAAAAGAALPPVLAQDAIAVDGGRILARDVASTSPDGAAVIAVLPAGAGQVELSEAQRIALLHNRFPSGRFALLHRGTVQVARGRATAPAAEPGICYAAHADIPAGATVDRELVERVACARDAGGRWLAHDDRSSTLSARRDIPAGTYLGRIRPEESDAVAAGSRLVFRTSEGPVTIEREVVALQPARAGRHLYARTQDGDVLRATLAEENEE